MKTPDQIKQHNSKYKDDAWKKYEPLELAYWVVLLAKRATHRDDAQKAQKDLLDARNYLSMFQAWVDHMESEI